MLASATAHMAGPGAALESSIPKVSAYYVLTWLDIWGVVHRQRIREESTARPIPADVSQANLGALAGRRRKLDASCLLWHDPAWYQGRFVTPLQSISGRQRREPTIPR